MNENKLIKISVIVERIGKQPFTTESKFTEKLLETAIDKGSIVDIAMQQIAYDIKKYLGLIPHVK